MEWALHVYCVRRMVLYFFAAADLNYAKYIVWYLIENLPEDVVDIFKSGGHVCRHETGV